MNRTSLASIITAVALGSGLLALLYLTLGAPAAKAQVTPAGNRAPLVATTITPVIIGPDLMIAAVTVNPPTPTIQSTGDIQIVVQNRGTRPAAGFTVYLYVDAVDHPPTVTTPAVTHLFYNTTLAPGGIFTWTRTAHRFTRVAPAIQVWVDPPWENRVAETNERNNRYPQPRPALAQIQPNQAEPGRALTVTVTGTNTEWVTARTYADFGAGITVTGMTVISPTQAQIGLQVDAAARLGWRTVTMQSAGAVITQSNGFRVATRAQEGATLYIDPTPATLLVSETQALAIVLAPGTTPINGVQIHGSVDPTYLRLVDVLTQVTPLAENLDPLAFDPLTGEFTWSAGELGETISTPFTVLTLRLEGVRPTSATVTSTVPTTITFRSDFPATDVTGPTGSSLAAAYDGRVFVTDRSQVATVQGRVDLQGRPFRPHRSLAIPLLVELTPTDPNMRPLKQLVLSDPWGEFRLNPVPVGDYSVRIKGDHTLANRIERVTLHAGLNQLYLGLLLEGDVETQQSGNRVVMADFSLLSAAFDHCRGDAAFLANADLNENGCVTIEDSVLVYANFNRQGDLIFATPATIPAPLPTPGRRATLTFLHPARDWLTPTQPITLGLMATATVVVTAGEVISLPLYIDPGEGEVLGATVALGFDPALLTIEGVTLSQALPQILLGLTLDNQAGQLRFSVQALPGSGMTTPFQVATVRAKLINQRAGGTNAALLLPSLDGPQATDIVGQQGSMLAGVTGVRLVSRAAADAAYTLYLPAVSVAE